MGMLALNRECSLLFVSNTPPDEPNPLMEALGRRHKCVLQTAKTFAEARPNPSLDWTGVIIDTDLTDAHNMECIKRGAAGLDRNETFLVMIVDPYGLTDLRFAMSMNSDRVISRIVVDESAAFQSPQLRTVIELARADFVKNGLDAIEWLILKYSKPTTLAVALTAGELALDSIFQLGKTKGAFDRGEMDTRSDLIRHGLEEHGLKQWLDTVREHHNATYRHSLAVTGVATAFAQHLNFPRADIERVMLAGLLHDVGKAKVPVEILEKRSKLTEREEAVLRLHPINGRRMLAEQKGIDDDILDAISNHHEFIDGSGYPNRLSNGEIGDMTRIITISDCFANLISINASNDAASGPEAFGYLRSMNRKLDMPLVRAFKGVVDQLGA